MCLGVGAWRALFVHPGHRGKGLGRTLVSFAATLHPTLDTEINAREEQALGFYRRLGYVEIVRCSARRLLAEAIR